MKSVLQLPENYRQSIRIDLQHDKKTAVLVNVLAGVAALVMALVGFFIRRPDLTLSKPLLLKTGIVIFGMIAYIFLHEAVHGLFMKLLGQKGTKIHYGFTGLYAYAGSENAFFAKAAYYVVALAPLTLFFVVFFLLCLLLPPAWFWTVYLLQIINISGAAGDVYVAFRLLKQPETLFVRDTGTEMTAYAPTRGA